MEETFKEYPSAAVRLIETLLSVDPTLRGTAATTLKNEVSYVFDMCCACAIWVRLGFIPLQYTLTRMRFDYHCLSLICAHDHGALFAASCLHIPY